VINEDRVDPGTGFGLHTHREFEIFSYVVSGALEHKDSMGNTEILRRGDLQLTSAGTGIRHSEHQYGAVPVHFLQIWAMPHTRGLPPRYFTRHIGDEEKKDKWAQIVAPVGEDGVVHEREGPGPAPVQSGLRLAAAVISPGTKLMHTMPTLQGGRKVYVHITQSSGWNPRPAKGAAVQLSGTEAKATLREGDGAYIHGVSGSVVWVENIGNTTAEVLLFDLDL
jgi:redox-sensitive bicupin YhaK (pirin superfamily)